MISHTLSKSKLYPLPLPPPLVRTHPKTTPNENHHMYPVIVCVFQDFLFLYIISLIKFEIIN